MGGGAARPKPQQKKKDDKKNLEIPLCLFLLSTSLPKLHYCFFVVSNIPYKNPSCFNFVNRSSVWLSHVFDQVEGFNRTDSGTCVLSMVKS